MKWISTLAIAVVPAFLDAACSRESRAAPPKSASKLSEQDRSMPPSANPTPAPAPDANAATRRPVEPPSETSPPVTERLLSDEDAAIPTQEEADREAELAITEENADQEFEKLERELQGGG